MEQNATRKTTRKLLRLRELEARVGIERGTPPFRLQLTHFKHEIRSDFIGLVRHVVRSDRWASSPSAADQWSGWRESNPRFVTSLQSNKAPDSGDFSCPSILTFILTSICAELLSFRTS